MSLEDDVETFLTGSKQGALRTARSMQEAHQLVMYAETHVGLSKKAEFMARVMRSSSVRYHASEHFLNTRDFGRAVEAYLNGTGGRSGLDSRVRSLAPVLDVIKESTGTRGLIFAGSRERGGVRRHRRIFDNFVSSRALHLRARRFQSGDRGMFHIGAFHAARLPQQGSSRSTTQHLIASGINVGVIRLMVDVPSSVSSNESGALVITADEAAEVAPVAGGRSFDLIPILRRAGSGSSFGVDISGQRNPFRKIKPSEVTSSRSFADYYDRLVFLP